MDDVVNLNRARKAKARSDAKAKAAENRVVFGRTAAQKAAPKAEAERAAQRLDGHRLTNDKP